MPVTLIEQGREINTQFASVVDGSELVIICSFVIQLPGAGSDTLDLVYPLQTLKPIASQLRSRVQSDSNQENISWRDMMEKAILEYSAASVGFAGTTGDVSGKYDKVENWRCDTDKRK